MVDRATAIQELIEIAESNKYSGSTRLAAVEGLGYAGGDKARAYLLKVIRGDGFSGSARQTAALALGRAAASED